MYCWYLRNTYLENNLRQPGKRTVCGEKVDLGAIDAPVYIYGSREDHIVPWHGGLRVDQHPQRQAPLRARRVGPHRRRDQPAGKNKRSHWIDDTAAADQRRRLARRAPSEKPGSWWTDWAAWLKTHGGTLVAAPKAPGSTKYKAIEPAPGRYVKAKA